MNLPSKTSLPQFPRNRFFETPLGPARAHLDRIGRVHLGIDGSFAIGSTVEEAYAKHSADGPGDIPPTNHIARDPKPANAPRFANRPRGEVFLREKLDDTGKIVGFHVAISNGKGGFYQHNHVFADDGARARKLIGLVRSAVAAGKLSPKKILASPYWTPQPVVAQPSPTTEPTATPEEHKMYEIAYRRPGKKWARSSRRGGSALEKRLEKLAEQGAEVRTRVVAIVGPPGPGRPRRRSS